MKAFDLDRAEILAAYEFLTPEERLQADGLLAESIPEGLPEFFLCANPGLKHPEHLYRDGQDKNGASTGRSLGWTLAAAVDEPQNASFSTPPQFGKTVMLLTGLLRFALRRTSTNAYVSYNEDIAFKKSDLCRAMCQVLRIQVTGPKSCLKLATGSEIIFTAVCGPLEGNPVTGMLILDDPYKSRLEAESAAIRKRVSDWFRSTALGRTHPTSSVIINMHRWTSDDLVSELEEMGFVWTNYPALDREDRSLWEEFKSAEWLKTRRKQVGPFSWESEYQGNPTAKGGRVFEGLHFYTKDTLPRVFTATGIGVDFAYTAKTASDWSIAVVLGEHNAEWYVREVLRRQCKADVFAGELEQLTKKYPGAQMRWDASTTERGTADIIRRFVKVPLSSVLAQGDAFSRAQLVGAAWRQGKVWVPEQDTEDFAPTREWMPEFARVLTGFVGGDDAEDDDVVALASAFALLPAKPIVRAPAFGSPEWVEAQQQKDFKDQLARVRQTLQQREKDKRWGRS